MAIRKTGKIASKLFIQASEYIQSDLLNNKIKNLLNNEF